MSPAFTSLIHELRPVIVEKRARLQSLARTVSEDYLKELLREIDAALDRMDDGSFGLCEACHDTIEAERLARDPLARFCLDHLNAQQKRAHEQDLELATQIQAKILPARDVATEHWRAHYRYQPAGIVGGDYCEIVAAADGRSVFFALGDITGKGVAASLLMTNLSATFRSLLSLDLPLGELVMRANRLFCESTPATHFATLVAGRATETGLEICNAGHCPPLVLRQGGTERVEPTALPIGLFSGGRYDTRDMALDPGETVVLYTDGVTETQDRDGNAYDEERLVDCLRRHAEGDIETMAEGVLEDVGGFRDAGPQQDDVTLLMIRRHSQGSPG